MLLITLLLWSMICRSAYLILVEIEQGILQGELRNRSTCNGFYYSFKGIPYAAPPVGDLRFKAPRPPLPWNGIRKALTHGSVCPQLTFDTNEYIPGNENCLFLNIYTPIISSNTSLPVMIYIHGGAFQSGSGNEDRFGPDFLLDNGVVVVTINFRLGALGFLCLNIPEAPGNAGLKDQVVALRWVKRNINRFCGDPDNITIFGQSSGGSSVSLHALSPLSKNLFERAIAMSGVCFNDFSSDIEPKRHGLQLAHKLGLYTTDPNEAFKFLQNASVQSIVNTIPNVLAIENLIVYLSELRAFKPVVEANFGEEHFLLEDPQQILLKGENNNVKLVLGHTVQEGLLEVLSQQDNIFRLYPYYKEMLVPIKISSQLHLHQTLELADCVYNHYFGNKEINVKHIKSFIDFYSYFTFVYDIYRYLEMWIKSANQAYFYVFSAFTERNINGKIGLKYGIRQATHGDDLMYLFDSKMYNLTLNKTIPSYKMIVQMTKLFTDFAKCGNPTPDSSLGVFWPLYNSNQTVLDMDLKLTLRNTSEEMNEINFWRQIFQNAGQRFS